MLPRLAVILLLVSAGCEQARRAPSGEEIAAKTPPGMVYIPPGEFIMGADDGQVDERPRRTVFLDGYFIDRFKVTNGEYEKFVKATGHKPPPGWKDGKVKPGQEALPVVDVNWDDAVAYAKWCGKRLPTEEEWEKAARGPSGKIYPWGDEWDATMGAADWKPHPADFKPEAASVYGCLGMVHVPPEWTSSKYTVHIEHKNFPPVINEIAYALAGIELYSKHPREMKVLDSMGAVKGDLRVVKGGSKFLRNAWTCRSSYREPYDARIQNTGIGFRCAKSP